MQRIALGDAGIQLPHHGRIACRYRAWEIDLIGFFLDAVLHALEGCGLLSHAVRGSAEGLGGLRGGGAGIVQQFLDL